MKFERGTVGQAACVAAVLVVLAPLACKSPGHKPTDAAVPQDAGLDTDAPVVVPDASADGADDALNATSACRASITTQCQRQVVCRGLDMADCVEIADRCPAYYFNPTSKRTVTDIQACLPALAAMTCTDIAMALTPPCLVSGTAPAGTACRYNTECEFRCTDGLDQCSTCYAGTRVATGEACDATRGCPSTDFCHSVARVCVSKTTVLHAGEGEACDFGAQPAIGCSGDLVCARATTSGTAGTCRPLPKLGEPCVMAGDVISQQCGPGLLCEASTTTCQPPKPPGCGDGGACDVNSFCQNGLLCAPRAAEGQPCRWSGTAEPQIDCVANIWCVLAPDAGRNGVCTRPGTIGDACDSTHPCVDSLCAGGRCGEFDPARCQLAPDAGTD